MTVFTHGSYGVLGELLCNLRYFTYPPLLGLTTGKVDKASEDRASVWHNGETLTTANSQVHL